MTQKLNRRQFLRRGALLAAGSLAAPPWAQWLGEQEVTKLLVKGLSLLEGRG